MELNIFKTIKSKSGDSEYTRNVLTLMTGSVVAQAIPLAFSPVLSRIFTPNDFGVLAFFMSVVSIIATVVTLKYETAIILPEKDEDSANLVGLSVILSFIISFISLIVVVVFNKAISDFSADNKNEISKWLYFVPVSVLFIGLYNSLNYWSNRKSQYKRLAASRIVQSGSMTGFQIGVGLLRKSALGLLFGEIAGRVFSTLYLAKVIWKEDKGNIKSIKKQKMKEQFKRYKSFPIFSLPADITNVVSNQVPIFMLGKFFGGTVLGSYAFMDKILSAPLSLIVRSILDVFKQRASEDYVKNGNCLKIFLKTYKALVLIAVVPTLIIFFIAPPAFDFIFGSNWRMAGEYARILSLLFFFRFTVSPLSYVVYIAEKQKYDLIWQLCLLLITIIVFSIGVIYKDVKIGLILFSVSYSLMYVVYWFMSYKFAKGNNTNS
ncbi:MAG: oligosaccharide flippase family protein [Bacteroidales bacterium]|nr:oligosaccharide flippase family protein [Bacteroidales bacterium]